jgi:hypothetical protein
MPEIPNSEPTAKDTSLSDETVDMHNLSDLTLQSTTATQQVITPKTRDEMHIKPQGFVESGGEDTRRDSDGMETEDETKEITLDTSSERTPTYNQQETTKKGTIFTTPNTE